MAKTSRVTASRLGRLGQLGLLAGGLAGGMLGEGARQLAGGKRPSVGDLLLTPVNARRLTDRLAKMRGAAMKVGQLISMDGGQLLPRDLTEILSRLRDDASAMPLGQTAAVLKQAWGENWQSAFARFGFTPIACASIGQVHEAHLRDGRHLAVKVQYPGVARSIDSDIDNVGTLLRLTRLLPDGMDIDGLLDEAKQQLHAEADYHTEATYLRRYRSLLAGDTRYQVPRVHDDYTHPNVLSMDFLGGRPIATVADEARSTRHEVALNLLELAFNEVFVWGLVQTDPNFSNYLYDPNQRRIQLLDFGATRAYDADRRAALHRLLLAGVGADDADIAEAARAVGYLGDDDSADYRNTVVHLLRMVSEPLRQTQPYDFARSDLAKRMTDVVVDMRMRNQHGRLPPTDILFLHRKLAGLYLLLAELRVKPVLCVELAQFLDRGERTAAEAGMREAG